MKMKYCLFTRLGLLYNLMNGGSGFCNHRPTKLLVSRNIELTFLGLLSVLCHNNGMNYLGINSLGSQFLKWWFQQRRGPHYTVR